MMASDMKDIFVLNLVDSREHPADAARYSTISNLVYIPFIRLEAGLGEKYAIANYYAQTLGDMVADGDIQSDMATLICSHSNYCSFEGGKIARTY
jgi:hypothetical protein